jgi:hypothetical protein
VLIRFIYVQNDRDTLMMGPISAARLALDDASNCRKNAEPPAATASSSAVSALLINLITTASAAYGLYLAH